MKAARLARRPCRDSGEVGLLALRENAAQLHANRAQAARARRCMRRETAIRPTAESMPEFSKIERREPGRRPVADEQNNRNRQRRPSSLRRCARCDSRPCGRARAIAGKHPARAPREMPRRRKSQYTRARDLLNALTCSLRCELVSGPKTPQEIFARSTTSEIATKSSRERHGAGSKP